MRSVISRWFMFGLLLGGAISHATVLAQGTTSSSSSTQQPGATAGSSGSSAQPGPPVKSASADAIRKALDKTITLDYIGPLIGAINQIRERTGLPIKADQSMYTNRTVANNEITGPPGSEVEVKAKNEKAGAVLRRLLNGQRLTYVIMEDSLLITSERTAMTTQLRQRVAVDVEDVPLKKAVRRLAKNHGINLVIDPKVAKEAETAVSLQLANVSVETGCRLLAEMANLKAVRLGDVMFITNETKAEKIRKEEQDQYQYDQLIGGEAWTSPIDLSRWRAMPAAPPFPGSVPAPPPGIDLPRAVPNPGADADPRQQAPKKVIDIRNPPGLPPPPPFPMIPGRAVPPATVDPLQNIPSVRIRVPE